MDRHLDTFITVLLHIMFNALRPSYLKYTSSSTANVLEYVWMWGSCIMLPNIKVFWDVRSCSFQVDAMILHNTSILTNLHDTTFQSWIFKDCYNSHTFSTLLNWTVDKHPAPVLRKCSVNMFSINIIFLIYSTFFVPQQKWWMRENCLLLTTIRKR
jgi:hypothetical protein